MTEFQLGMLHGGAACFLGMLIGEWVSNRRKKRGPK